jgi:hypothetical protein
MRRHARKLLVVGYGVRSRSDQRHFSANYVYELGQLIQIGSPHKSADACYARIAGLAHLLYDAAIFQCSHRAKFPNKKDPSPVSATALAKQ